MSDVETTAYRTLGQRLADQVTMMTARRALSLAGSFAAAEVCARLDALPHPARSARRRIEVPVAELGTDTEHPPELRWPSPADAPATSVPLPGRQTLDGTTVERLRPLLGADPPRLHVRDDPAADQVARTHGADAVTVGDEILFRTGHFAPTEPKGFALVAHEVLHAAANHTSAASWNRATTAGVAEEEEAAERVESAALTTAGPPPSGDLVRSPIPQHSIASGPASHAPTGRTPQVHPPASAQPTAASTPMPARVDRNLDRGPAQQPPLPDLTELSESLYRDLLRRIKADAERGG